MLTIVNPLQPTIHDELDFGDVPIDLSAPISYDLQRLMIEQQDAGHDLSAVPMGMDDALLLLDDQGRVGTRITATDVDGLEPVLVDLGMEIWGSFPEHYLIEGALPIAAIGELESLVDLGMQGALAIPKPVTSVGLVTSQADVVHETDRVRNSLPMGFDGTGVTIGVLSDSYDVLGGAAAGVASGDLPNVTVLQELASGGTDEGRAMVELIHDLAPGADVAFATAFGGEAVFANNIRALADFGSDVIVDDVINLFEPFFQDGIVAQAVDDVVTNQGVTYFSSAGNNADQAYESAFRPANDIFFADVFHDFDPGPGVDTRQSITLAPGQSITFGLQWDDPFLTANGVDTDLTIGLFADGTNTVVALNDFNNVGFQVPVEIVSFTNLNPTPAQFDVFIVLNSGPAPAQMKYLNFGASGSGPITFNEFGTFSPTVVGHAAAANANSVGAVDYFDQDVPDVITAEGPTTILFNADGTRKGSPETRQTPTFAAIHTTDTTFFGFDVDGNGFPNFSGTSAAAPHAAAVAALMLQADPTLTPQQVQTTLINTAEDIGAPGSDVLTGAGLINAYDAIFGAAQAASLDFNDGFESGVLSNNWETETSGAGQIEVTTANGPNTGAFHLTMDTIVGVNLLSLNEATLVFDATTASGDIILDFSQREFGDEDNPMPETFAGSVGADGVAFSVDGVNYFRLVSLTGTTSQNTYQDFSFNLTNIADGLGLTLSSTTRVRFQQFDNFPIDGFPDAADGFAFDDIEIRVVAPETFQIAEVVPTTTGFIARFNEAIDTLPINLFGFDPADVVLTGPGSSPVIGSLVTTQNLGEIQFIATDGVLAPGNYVATIRSGMDAFQNLAGELLDGDGDGTPGGDFSSSFSVSAFSGATVGLTNFTRGAGQDVELPVGTPGIPLIVEGAENADRIAFSVNFDPNLLNIDGVVAGADTPLGTTASFSAVPGSGQFDIEVLIPGGGLPGGTLELIRLLADVPDTAPLTAKHVLDINNLVVEDAGAAVDSRDRDALHLAAYPGDAFVDDLTYSIQDAIDLLNATLGTPLTDYVNVDPAILADINGNGLVDLDDVVPIISAAIGQPAPELPVRPALTPPIPTGLDPRLEIARIQAEPGQAVPVPLSLTNTDVVTVGLQTIQAVIEFDPESVTVNAVSSGQFGDNYELLWNVDASAGLIFVVGYRLDPLDLAPGDGGELAWIDLEVADSLVPGDRVGLNLRSDVATPWGSIATGLNGNTLVMIPAPTNAPDDEIDGQIDVVASLVAENFEASPTSTASLVAASPLGRLIELLGFGDAMARVQLSIVATALDLDDEDDVL